MLPHHHFAIAGLVIAPAGIVLAGDDSAKEVGTWIMAGGVASMIIDLDILVLVLARSRKEPLLKIYRNPLRIFSNFKDFMNAITKTGVLKTGMITHLLGSAIVLLIAAHFLKPYVLPIMLGIISHIVSDIPNLRRLN